MAKFSIQVENLKEQTDLLRKNLSIVTGIDCSRKSIGECALVSLEKTNTDFVEPETEEDYGYVRPSWYPNIKEILNNAEPITKDSVVYYPAYIVLTSAITVSENFYKAMSTSSTAANYLQGTGADAYLFSDVVDNNILNQSSDNLEVVSGTITHNWDISKDIANPENDKDTKVRWVIVYVKNKTTSTSVHPGSTTFIELITSDFTLAPNSFSGVTYANNPFGNSSIKYIEIQENTKYAQITAVSTSGLGSFSYRTLEEVRFNTGLKTITKGSSANITFNACDSLKKVVMPGVEKIDTSIFNSCPRLKKLEFPSLTHLVCATFCSSCANLRSVTFSEKLSVFETSDTFIAARSLTSFTFPMQLTSIKCVNSFENCQNLETVIMPNNLQYLDLTNSFKTCVKLKNIIMPAYIETMSLNNSFNVVDYGFFKIPKGQIINTAVIAKNTKYKELYENFDISGIRFGNDLSSYNTKISLSVQWVKDLCFWLKDRTGEEPNTIIVGSLNIEKFENIYLTFDINNKRNIIFDGVNAQTDGAISVLNYITNQLNWTIS